jgi:hypothetical protein
VSRGVDIMVECCPDWSDNWHWRANEPTDDGNTEVAIRGDGESNREQDCYRDCTMGSDTPLAHVQTRPGGSRRTHADLVGGEEPGGC